MEKLHGGSPVEGVVVPFTLLSLLVFCLLALLLLAAAAAQVMARVGRGALVGLPAVGALFVAHLAHQDWHRLIEERAAGESEKEREKESVSEKSDSRGGGAMEWGVMSKSLWLTWLIRTGTDW